MSDDAPSLQSSAGTGVSQTSVGELPNLNGIRALACLMVVVAHVPETFKVDTVGATGVALFFVLSGFLMGYLYGHKSWSTEAAGEFAIARFARIAPIYWLTILVCAALTPLLGQPDFPLQLEGWQLIGRHLLFGGSSFVFWSISPEVQFYIFFLYLWWSLNSIASRRVDDRTFTVLVLIVVCSTLLLTHSLWAGLSLPSKAHLFLAGCAAGMAPRGRVSNFVQGKKLIGLQMCAVVLLVLPIFLYSTQPQLYLATEVGLSMAVAIYLLSFPSTVTGWLLGSNLMRRIGQASFSIYLTHMLVLYAGGRLLGLDLHHYEPLWVPIGVLAVALPMVLSAYVEIPMQRITRRFLLNQWRFHARTLKWIV
ncbi:acyltransferase [Curvibacter sp. APW13]|uniref:acyltransferase family protein n=1 Tax=Curvibacter sp. APW13 TaxID=3077236 RepID=UPI0028DF49E7|nr:acyltransferase [Curvibacter sp. APW13]MDT8992595.1 acyltransferase [Curvibacter sp. APW13]